MKRDPRLDDLIQFPTHGYDPALSRADNIAIYKAQTHQNIRAALCVVGEHLNLETHREVLLKLVEVQAAYDRVPLTDAILRGLELLGPRHPGRDEADPGAPTASSSVTGMPIIQ